MSDTNNNQSPAFVNPLQTNNSIVAIVAYIAGIAAAKLPIFDLATWNYIIMGVFSLVFVGSSAIINRKSTVVTTAATMPEVSKIELNRNVAGASNLANSTPSNVVTK